MTTAPITTHHSDWLRILEFVPLAVIVIEIDVLDYRLHRLPALDADEPRNFTEAGERVFLAAMRARSPKRIPAQVVPSGFRSDDAHHRAALVAPQFHITAVHGRDNAPATIAASGAMREESSAVLHVTSSAHCRYARRLLGAKHDSGDSSARANALWLPSCLTAERNTLC